MLWASSANSEFNFDSGASYTDDQAQSALGEGESPPVLRQMAASIGTDAVCYISQAPRSAPSLSEGAVYHTYSTQARGLEFLMGYYPILDRAPRGRDEGDPSGHWLRRHDEYGEAAG